MKTGSVYTTSHMYTLLDNLMKNAVHIPKHTTPHYTSIKKFQSLNWSSSHYPLKKRWKNKTYFSQVSRPDFFTVLKTIINFYEFSDLPIIHQNHPLYQIS